MVVYMKPFCDSPAVKVSLFIPCFIDQIYPQVGVSIVQVLERLGHEVDYPEGQTCCGQPPFNSGYWDEARKIAEHQLDVFKDCDVVVSASGSCGAMMKVFYPELFQGTTRHFEALKLAQFYADRTLTKNPITPGDQAEAIFLLLTNRLSKTTGQVITVDGGLYEAFLR